MPPDAEREPSARELAEIEAEWPLIDADLAVTDAQAAIAAGFDGELGRSRLAAALRRRETVAAEFEPAGLGRFRPRRRARSRRRVA
jgi:hypothetical protein